jgi:hypothetical protein
MRRILILLPLLLLGCEQPPPRLAGSGMDMFAPVKIRLHKLSRVVFPATAPATASTAPAPSATLEVHVELSDQFGDAGKGVGDLTLRLLDPASLGSRGTVLETWNLTLNAPEPNRDHWDRTTRTYLFKFPLPASLPRDRDHYTLSATFTLPNNTTLTDELLLPLK